MVAAQLAIGIVDLALSHGAEGFGEQPDHLKIAGRDALLRRLRKQIVADQTASALPTRAYNVAPPRRVSDSSTMSSCTRLAVWSSSTPRAMWLSASGSPGPTGRSTAPGPAASVCRPRQNRRQHRAEHRDRRCPPGSPATPRPASEPGRTSPRMARIASGCGETSAMTLMPLPASALERGKDAHAVGPQRAINVSKSTPTTSASLRAVSRTNAGWLRCRDGHRREIRTVRFDEQSVERNARRHLTQVVGALLKVAARRRIRSSQRGACARDTPDRSS